MKSRTSRFLPGLRALLTLGRELHGLRLAAERIADHLEGKVPPPVPAPDAPEEPLTVAVPDEVEYARAYHVESRLRTTLGRTPTADEIVQELDGIEWDPSNPTVVVGQRKTAFELPTAE